MSFARRKIYFRYKIVVWCKNKCMMLMTKFIDDHEAITTTVWWLSRRVITIMVIMAIANCAALPIIAFHSRTTITAIYEEFRRVKQDKLSPPLVTTIVILSISHHHHVTAIITHHVTQGTPVARQFPLQDGVMTGTSVIYASVGLRSSRGAAL